ncbi:hypothetical protein Glove_256g110 [Diversispora epigaea]|uniref:BACK domain-containing protein n=1 Tax=Diversispora epigaea TaxID=1348612 RepID=A0A397IFN7_9GLOM|nr:hypothetical protein Glove_256g110 [Diversispora epigaea]
MTLLNLLKVNYYISIEVGKEAHLADIDIYKVHSIILQSRSSLKKNSTKFLNDDHTKIYLSWKFSLEKLENSVIFDLLIVIASNELELDELVGYLQTHLINNCASWLRSKFAQIYRISYQVKNLEIIQNFYALVSILERDDSQLEESKIWEFIVQWRKDVVEKIYPYQLLKHQLFSDITIKSITPTKPISLKIFSTRITPIPFPSNIIANEHALEVSS